MSVIHFTDATFEQEVINDKGLVMVDFFATWCGPCKMLAPVVEKLAEEYKGKAKIGKMDVDENGQTGMKFGIQSIPTIIFFKGGKPVQQLVGFQSAEALKQQLDSL
jgi:thioredoxin 1